MKRKRCGWCKTIYITSVDTPRYCSVECKKSAMRDKRERWKENNPNYMKNYMRKYRNTKYKQLGEDKKVNRCRCRNCGVVKQLVSDNFYKNKNRKTGFESQCKECQKKNDASWYKENKQRISANKKKYYQQNKEKIKARQREYYKSKESSL